MEGVGGVIVLLLDFLIGAALGVAVLYFYQNSRGKNQIQLGEAEAKKIVGEAEARARGLIKEAEDKSKSALDEVERGLGRRLQQDLIDEAAAYLTARSGAAGRSGLEIKTEVRVGPAADNIYEFVETYGTDLIVMATHGRTGVQRWVYGSVTEKVLHSVNTSLLVVRPVSPARYSMRSTE